MQCGQHLRFCIVCMHDRHHKRVSSANVKPGIPNAKNNQFFCIKTGTTVVWMSSKKNNGFSSRSVLTRRLTQMTQSGEAARST